MGVSGGIERVSKVMMPVLVGLAVVISIYVILQPGAFEGVKYMFIPKFSDLSVMTVVAALGQMFYSLSIAMGVLITFGSYMKKDVGIESSAKYLEIFDTGIAILAGLMIIPAVFAFSGGDPEALNAGPALMFITMPKVFAAMKMGRIIGILFFLLAFLAALTSAISLTESAVATFEDQLGWKRLRAAVFMAIIMLVLGTLSALGYGPLEMIKIGGLQFLDFFDYLTNTLLMPVAALFICFYITRSMGLERATEEVELNGQRFRRKKMYSFMMRYICPVFILVILISSLI